MSATLPSKSRPVSVTPAFCLQRHAGGADTPVVKHDTLLDERITTSRSTRDLGRKLREVRRQLGLSRSHVARSAGLTRRELAAYERGRVVIPEGDLWCVAGSCGVEMAELLPPRDELRIDAQRSSLTIGDRTRSVPQPAAPDGLLGEYLAMIAELRERSPESRPESLMPFRAPDLAILADALGDTPDAIEARLVALAAAARPFDAPHDSARYAAAIRHPAPAVDDFFAGPATERAAAHHAVESSLPVVDAPQAVAVAVRDDPLAGLPLNPFPRASTEDGLSPIVPMRDLWSTGSNGSTGIDPITPIAWRAP
jgi:transcriptional regulator with XRE-family HTH domain